MISQIIAEVLLNISRVLNKFKSFPKQVYQKEWTQNIFKKSIKIITSEQKEARNSNKYLDV